LPKLNRCQVDLPYCCSCCEGLHMWVSIRALVGLQ
jgi:hypothetical protein